MALNLHFGLHFDTGTQPHQEMRTGHVYLGCRQLLRWFETQLGLDGHPERVEHIRVEQYRQALSRYQKGDPSVFYAKSFYADQLATAENLLARRDELLAAGWSLDKMHTLYSDENAPIRLKVLADIEAKFLTDEHGKTKLVADETERFEAVLHALATKEPLPIDTFFVNEPMQFLPPHYNRLFTILRSKNIEVKQLELIKLNELKSINSNKSKLNKPNELDLFNSINVDLINSNQLELNNENELKTDLNTFKNFVENKLERGNDPTAH